jgi:hypothetical protein
MRLFSKAVLSVSVILGLGVSNAQASVFVWDSPDANVSVSFGDDWARVHNQKPHDLLTVKAPGDHDYATCVISATQDERFKIYPAHYDAAIQRENFSKTMWENYYNGQTSTVYHLIKDDAGLGDGFASMASVSYETAVGPRIHKRAIAFASLYGNTLYGVECSAEESAYERWHDRFLSFVKAVDFKRTTNHALSGYYRDFIDDGSLLIKGQYTLEDTYH